MEWQKELDAQKMMITELRTTGRTERPKEDEKRDSQVTKEMSGLMSMLGRGGEVEKAPERKTDRTDSSVRHYGHVRAIIVHCVSSQPFP